MAKFMKHCSLLDLMTQASDQHQDGQAGSPWSASGRREMGTKASG